MKCNLKNVECEYAGLLKANLIPEWGEGTGIRDYPVCFKALNYLKCILEE